MIEQRSKSRALLHKEERLELAKNLKRIHPFLFLFNNTITTGHDKIIMKKIKEVNEALGIYHVEITRVEIDKYGRIFFKIGPMEEDDL